MKLMCDHTKIKKNLPGNRFKGTIFEQNPIPIKL